VFARFVPWGAAGRSRQQAQEDAVTSLVIGLGNPGPEYAATRHNVGQMVADELARRYGGSFSRDKKNNAVTAAIRIGGAAGHRVVLGKPLSYMNLSGGPTKALAAYYSVPAESIIVIHDELDVPFGAIKLKRGGGSAGHNGLKDVTKALGDPDYVRVRVGVGRPPGRQDAADYVLRPFSATERKELDLLIALAADAVEDIIEKGLLEAQQRFHSAG
jgi:PTH1 family peptidyl-tRNA hydrolase